MLADLIGRATRAVHEVQPAAGHTRDAAATFPPGHGEPPVVERVRAEANA
jgi:hypothetical protein